MQIEQAATGQTLHWYDTDGDHQRDYAEELGANGRIAALRYLTAGQTRRVDLLDIPAAERRDLVVILDSIPQAVAEEAWQAGGLRFFAPPARIIAPFPVMTDVSLVDFFHLAPGVAIESDYYDGKRETDAYDTYLNARVAIWHQKVDYWLPHLAHSSAYLDQLPWYDHELRQIQDAFEHSSKPVYVGYSVGASALGALLGREGHVLAVSRIDRFSHEMVFRTQGRVRLTLLSDHGHSYYASRRIPLADTLKSFGYRITSRLSRPRDLVVPEFAMVSCAAIYTREPAPVAQDVLKIEGIELSAYVDTDDSLVVLSREGRARVRRSANGYRYDAVDGDPLHLATILDRLKQAGQVDAQGFVADAALFAATVDHAWPDAVDRLWRAFHDQFQHKPDVLISVAEGWHCGSAFQTRTVKLVAVHGNLHPAGTTGFALTSAGDLPAVVRMRDLAPALCRLGVDVLGSMTPCTPSASVPATASR